MRRTNDPFRPPAGVLLVSLSAAVFGFCVAAGAPVAGIVCAIVLLIPLVI